MLRKVQIVNVLVSVFGLAIMLNSFSIAQARAQQQKPVGWFVVLALSGLTLALSGVIRFYVERSRSTDYKSTEFLGKVLKDRSHKITPAYPAEEQITNTQVKKESQNE